MQVRHEVYMPCAQDSAIERYTILDGERAWPGGEAVSPQVGEPTMEISAALLMWEFFAAHPMPQARAEAVHASLRLLPRRAAGRRPPARFVRFNVTDDPLDYSQCLPSILA